MLNQSIVPAPFFTVIVPVYNGEATLGRCLRAIAGSTFKNYALIVVDDGSTDRSAEIASHYADRLLRTDGRSGPAAARNRAAAEAQGEWLFFTDADCALHADTLAQLAIFAQAHTAFDAAIGSYDAEPAERNFVSQYKNLLHHFTHQTSGDSVQTFWTGCGLIRRERFLRVGGFDAARYLTPSIEDIELGYRLSAAGGRIALLPYVQVKHLKRWTLRSMLASDIFDRALPWSELLLAGKGGYSDLNVQSTQRFSVGLVGMLGVLAGIRPRLAPLLMLPLLLLNRQLYNFLYQHRGGWFALRAIPLHWLYFFYSGCAYAFTLARRLRRQADTKWG